VCNILYTVTMYYVLLHSSTDIQCTPLPMVHSPTDIHCTPLLIFIALLLHHPRVFCAAFCYAAKSMSPGPRNTGITSRLQYNGGMPVPTFFRMSVCVQQRLSV